MAEHATKAPPLEAMTPVIVDGVALGIVQSFNRLTGGYVVSDPNGRNGRLVGASRVARRGGA